MRRRSISVAASMLLLATASVAHAQWSGIGAGGAGTDFSTSGNWTGGSVNGDFTSLTSSANLAVDTSLDFGTASPNASFTFNFNSGAAAGGLSLVIGDGVSASTTLGITGNITLSPRTTTQNSVTIASNVGIKLNSRLSFLQSASGTGQSPAITINGPVDLQTHRFQHAGGALTINGVISSTGATPANVASFPIVYGAGGDAAGLTFTNPNNSFVQNIAAGGFSSLTANSTVPIADSGVNSALGAGSSLGLNNSSINLLGFTSPVSSNRTWSVANTGTIRNNATASEATLNLTGDASAGSNNSFQLGGSNTGVNVYSGIYSGTGARLNKIDGGTWLVNNDASSFTGTVNAGGGNLRFTTIADIGVNSSLGASAVTSKISINNGSLVFVGTAAQTSNRNFEFANTGNLFNDAADSAATLTLTGPVTIPNAGWSANLRGNNTGNNLLTGVISGAGNLNKSGGGVWRVSNNASTFAGGVSVSGGRLEFTSLADYGFASSLGTGGTNSVIQINNATLAFVGSTPQSTNRTINSGNGFSFVENLGTAPLTLAGTIINNVAGGGIHFAGSYNGVNTVSGVIQDGTNVMGVNIDGSAWQFTNPASTFTGGVFVNAATSFTSIGDIGSPSSLGAGSATSVIQMNNAGLTFVGTAPQSTNRNFVAVNNGTLANDSADPAAIIGLTGTVTIPSPDWTLNLSGSNAGANGVASSVSGLIAGPGNLAKNGNGTWSVTNDANTFEGTVNVSQGTLQFTSIADFGTPSSLGTGGGGSSITLNNATLAFIGSAPQSSARNFLVYNNGFLVNNSADPAATLSLSGVFFELAADYSLRLGGSNTGNNTISGYITGGGLEKSGPGTWIVTNPGNDFLQNVTVSGGNLGFTNISDQGSSSSLGAGTGLVLNNGTLSYLGTDAQSTNRDIFLNQGGGISANGADANATLNLTGIVRAIGNAGSINLGGSNTGLNQVSGTLQDGDKVLGVVKSGTGTWNITGPVLYSGTTTVNGGILRIANTGLGNAVGGGDVTLNGAGQLLLDRGDDLAIANNFSGAGTLAKNNATTLTLTGNNDLSGTIAVNGGKLVVANDGNGGLIGTGTVSLAAGSSLNLARNDTASSTAAISGAGDVSMTGTGAVVLSGNLSYTGNTKVESGSLEVQTPLRPVTGSLVVTGPGATFHVNVPATPSAYEVVGEFSGISVGTDNAAQTSQLIVDDQGRGISPSDKAQVLVTSSVVLGSGVTPGSHTGFIDLGTSDLIIRNGAANLSTLRSYIAGWYTNGTAGLGSNFANPVLNTAPLSSAPTTVSLFVNDAGESIPYYSTYDGVSVGSSDVIVKFTYFGDLNIDGVVDGGDLASLIEGYSIGATGYAAGDVNYSGGVVDGTDVALFMTALNYFTSNPGLPSYGNGSGAGSGGGVVPEPAALGLLAVAAPLMASRRRRTAR